MNRKGQGTPGAWPGVRVWRGRADRREEKGMGGEGQVKTPEGGTGAHADTQEHRTERNQRGEEGMNETEEEGRRETPKHKERERGNQRDGQKRERNGKNRERGGGVREHREILIKMEGQEKK